MRCRVRWLLGLALSVAATVQAEVTTASADGFVLTHEFTVDAGPERVFAALTAEVSEWWDPAHSYSGDSANLTLDARAGGCFCEALAGGGSVEHMRVVFAAPGRLLRLSGGLGPLQAMGASGAMSFALGDAPGGGTRLRFSYTVAGYAADGLGSVAAPVDAVLGAQLERLAAYLAASD